MSFPAGTIWIAGAGGDCSQAGTCPGGGPCGDGVASDCPSWVHEQVIPFSWAGPGHSVIIGGRTCSVGESLVFPRPADLFTPRQYAYPFEIERTKDPSIPGTAGDYMEIGSQWDSGSPTSPVLWLMTGTSTTRVLGPYGITCTITGPLAGTATDNTGNRVYFWQLSGSVLQLAGRDRITGAQTSAFYDLAKKVQPIISYLAVSWTISATNFWVLYSKEYSSIPLTGGGVTDEAETSWAAAQLVDTVTLLALPANPGTGVLGVKLTSACEDAIP